MAAVALDHAGHDCPCHIQQSFNIRINHFFPVLQGRDVLFVEPATESGIVDENVDGLPGFRKIGDRSIDSVRLLYI